MATTRRKQPTLSAALGQSRKKRNHPSILISLSIFTNSQRTKRQGGAQRQRQNEESISSPRAKKKETLVSDQPHPAELDADAPRRRLDCLPVRLRHGLSLPSRSSAPPQERGRHLRRGPGRRDRVARLCHDGGTTTRVPRFPCSSISSISRGRPPPAAAVKPL